MHDCDPGQSDEPGGDPGLDEAAMRDAVARVLDSAQFSATPRLREFLAYVTNEAILGNTDSLRAKSIAHFVYHRDPVDERSSANVVRVEARRLRRLLDDYYQTEGRADPVRVHIDKGGYAPRFEHQTLVPARGGPRHPPPADPAGPASPAEAPPSAAARPHRRPLRVWSPWGAGLLLAAGAAGLALVLLRAPPPTPLSPTSPGAESERAGREALMAQSPAALEAANLTEQARGLIYPVFDAERQRLTTELFRAAIEIDPASAGAHAGAAQTLASLALLSIAGPQHDAYLDEARQMRDRALALDPSGAWSQSAAGWVAYVEGDADNALRYAERAVALAPGDSNVLDFYGVIAVMAGKWDKAIFAATQERQSTGDTTRSADRNILGAARFHLGEFGEALRHIEEGNVRGGPLSVPVVIYLAATYQAVGRDRDGRRMVALLEEDWPGYPVETVLKRLHLQDRHAEEVLDRLRALGWEG